ncbi:hypothetical protein SD72_16575, partial [Leucobacter komagatae]
VFNVGDLQPPLQARLRDPEVFRDPADRGFAPTSDRDDIATELQWECFGHGDHPSVRTKILTAQESTEPTAVPGAVIDLYADAIRAARSF